MSDDVFFCISAYTGNFDILKYSSNNIVYIKKGASTTGEPKNSIKIDNYGCNIYAYLLFIINNYNNLPRRVLFTKNNIFPRHMSETIFKIRLSQNSRYFFDPENCTYRKPLAYIDIDGTFCEINNSWYIKNNTCRYFGSLDLFLNHCFEFKDNPRYIRFPPGGNILVPQKDILCRPIEFYQMLVETINYKENAPESFLLERSLDLIFNPLVKLSKTFDKKIPVSQNIPYSGIKRRLQSLTLPLLQ